MTHHTDDHRQPSPREIAFAPKMMNALRVIAEIDANSSDATAADDLTEAGMVARCIIAQVENRGEARA